MPGELKIDFTQIEQCILLLLPMLDIQAMPIPIECFECDWMLSGRSKFECTKMLLQNGEQLVVD